MEEKFTLKVVQNGQTKLARQLRSGAGANGQALVVKAEEAASYQLVNQVTLTSPAKLQFKRKGDNLQVSLPGGDPDMPDLVIQNYFAVEGSAIKGISQSGEWMAYDTSVFVPKPVSPGDKSAKTFNPDNSAPVALGEVPVSTLVKFDSPLGLAAIGGGALALGAMGKGGGSGGGTPTPANNTDALSVIKSYAGAPGTAVQPTAAQYTAAGVTVPTVDGVTPANVLAALNQVISGKQAADVASKTQVQALADALKTSWALIVAEANGKDTDTTPSSAPTAVDYLNVGVKVGTTTKALDLMNSALGQLSSTSVNTAAAIKDLATAADNVMKVAAGSSGASLSKADLISLGLKVNASSSGITTEEAAAFTAQLANLESSLGKSDALKTGEAVDTIDELQALFSLQAMRSYNDDSAATKTQPAPGVTDYTNIGIKSYASLSDTTDASRVALDYKNFGLSNDTLASTLNSALDNQASGTALTKTVVQTVVDAYYKVLKETGSTTSNTGTYVETTYKPSIDEFKSLGITHVDKTALVATDTSLLSLLNSAIGRLSASAVDTASEIQALEKAAENLLAQGTVSDPTTPAHTYVVTYTTDSEWLSGFSALGISGVTASNLSGIKTAIDTADSATPVAEIGTKINEVKELQAIVSLYRINDYAVDDTINPLPTLADYQAILANQGGSLLSNGLNANLSSYNDAVRTEPLVSNNHTTFTEVQMKDLIVSFDKILKYADGDMYSALDPAPTLADLTNIGLGNGWTDAQKKFVSGDQINTPPVHSGTLKMPNNLALFVDVIGGKTKDQVNTIKELNDLANIVSRIIQLENQDLTGKDTSESKQAVYDNLAGGRLTISDFQSLGLDVTELNRYSGQVQTNRLYSVYDRIIDHANNTDTINSLSTLQDYINRTSGINA